MPFYICHKRVQALEIAGVGSCMPSANPGEIVRRVDFKGGFVSIDCPEAMFARYAPVPGDFYVVYEDGYQSFSPREAFLNGYKPEGQSFSDIKKDLKS
jgi:hypothetical protein